ncbi:MAG: hypothetical protein N7Q72_02885, partial [Spiroplasma sp. Tabriz.8]|nr:hypothetical protein [Spiroplasma sp. Tabriz.8]
IHLFNYSIICLCIYLFIHSFICLFIWKAESSKYYDIYLFIYLFIFIYLYGRVSLLFINYYN